MYLCQINITVLSSRNDIINAALSVKLPEDCEINCRAVTSFEDSISEHNSVAVIDSMPDEIEKARNLGAEYVVFAACSNDYPSMIDKAEKADFIIMLTGDAECDKRLLAMNMESVINRVKLDFDYHCQSVCFETSMDSIPDLVWFKDTIGTHLNVNNGFCKAVEKTKEQIYKKGHYYIWDIPKEEYDQGDYVCLESEQIVMDARETRLFDEKVKTKSGMRQFKTYKSPLINKYGEIFGTCGIAHDVTDIYNMNNELTVLIESMPFAIMIEDSKQNIVSCNSMFFEFFPDETDIVGKKSKVWKDSHLSRLELDEEAAEIFFKSEDGSRVFSFRSEYVTDAFDERIGKINMLRDITPARNSKMNAIHNANTDFLTSLSNRRSLFEHLSKCRRRAALALITVDLDNFKKVNDSFGHNVGDEALVKAAEIMKSCFSGDFIARMGGDEFLIVIEKNSAVQEIEKQANHLLDKFKDCFADRKEFNVMSASIGIAQDIKGTDGSIDVEGLMRKSDEALYYAKNSGKCKCCVFGKY